MQFIFAIFNYTPLHIAASVSCFEIVKILLENPTINVNALTIDEIWLLHHFSETPLHLAVSNGSYEIVYILIRNPKVDITIPDAFV